MPRSIVPKGLPQASVASAVAATRLERAACRSNRDTPTAQSQAADRQAHGPTLSTAQEEAAVMRQQAAPQASVQLVFQGHVPPASGLVRGEADASALAALSELDVVTGVIEALDCGYIRLLRTAWLLAQPETYLLENRQQLEARERQGGMSPLLSPGEAVALVRRAKRGMGTATHGWLSSHHVSATMSQSSHTSCRTPAHIHLTAPRSRSGLPRSQPDPAGVRLAVLRLALKQLAYIEGLFFVC